MNYAYMYATEEVGPHDVTAIRGIPAEAFAAIRDAGFSGVEFLVRDPDALNHSLLEREVQRAGLEVPAICTGEVFGEDGLSFTDPRPDIRAAAIRRMESAMTLAERFGAAVNVGRLRGRYHGGIAKAETRGWMVDAMRECCATCPNVRIVIEPVNRQFTNFLCGTGETVAFLRDLDLPQVGVMIDNVHVEIEGEDMAEALRVARPVLWHLHISDSARLPLGAGDYDIRATLALYAEARPEAYVTVETFQKPDDAAAIRQSSAFLAGLGSL